MVPYQTQSYTVTLKHLHTDEKKKQNKKQTTKVKTMTDSQDILSKKKRLQTIAVENTNKLQTERVENLKVASRYIFSFSVERK